MSKCTRPAWQYRRGAIPLFLILLAADAANMGCGGGGASPGPPPPPPPPPSPGLRVDPATATVLLGATQQFIASTSNSGSAIVRWSVNGVSGGSAALGTISPTGMYTAPQDLPAQIQVTIEATSVSDPSSAASAAVRVSSDISIGVTPASANVELGATLVLAAAIISGGNPDRSVNWSLSGPGCSGSSCGTIDPTGRYTAPPVLPSPPTVRLTATSAADPSKSATTSLSITSTFVLAVSGPTSVNAGAGAQYTATLTPAPNSNPSLAIAWSVSGAGCSGAACGTISSAGNYLAPALAPAPATLTLTATPAADPVKAASLAVTILAKVSVSVTPATANVDLGGSLTLTASVSGSSDTGVFWDVNGLPNGDAAVGTISPSPTLPGVAFYAAPLALPAANSVTLRARANADPTASATALITLLSNVSVALTPDAATRAISHRQTLAIQVTGTSNSGISWQINGIPGGSDLVGRICVAASNPCQPLTASTTSPVDYLAPAAVPTRNPVTITATSLADPAKSASAQVTIIAALAVSVSPASVTLGARAFQQFTASVLGTDTQDVTWQVTGGGCGGPGGPCGSVTATGLYTAPLAPPSPNSLTVSATSAEDTSRSGSASVSIATGPNVSALFPSSATAGAAGGFPLGVIGGGFVPTNPGPGSILLFAGAAKATTCVSAGECTAILDASDLATAGSRAVQLRNPDATTSNQVSFVILAPIGADDVVSLTPAVPVSTGKDIVVVEPSTAALSSAGSDLNLNILALGIFSPQDNSCTLAGSPVVLRRPTSGTAQEDLCAFSLSGLDPSFRYAVSGPPLGDLVTLARLPLGLGIIRLTFSLPSTALAGPRTLFVENPNKDRTAATGALRVK